MTISFSNLFPYWFSIRLPVYYLWHAFNVVRIIIVIIIRIIASLCREQRGSGMK